MPHLTRRLLVDTFCATADRCLDRGDLERAERASRRALKYSERLPAGLAASRRLRALASLGEAQRLAASYPRAEATLVQAIELVEASFSPEASERRTALNNLGVLYKDVGRFDDAERLYRDALAGAERASPADDLELATLCHNLGGLEHARGRYAEGEPFARRAVALRVRSLGEGDLAVAADRSALAAILDALGSGDEARSLLQQTLVAFERAYGPQHPEVAITLNNLAAIAQRGGDLDRAEDLYRRALKIKEGLSGPDHPEVATTLNNLATVLRAGGRSDEAAGSCERALGIFEAHLEPTHPSISTTRRNYARVTGNRTAGRPATVLADAEDHASPMSAIPAVSESSPRVLGVRVRMIRRGRLQHPSDLPIVVLHGWGAHLEAVEPIVAPLAAETEVVAVDLPGFGKSESPPEPWASEDYARFMTLVLEDIGISRCHLIGHSFGSRVAICLAAEHPNLVSRLILCDAAGLPPKRKLGYWVRVALAKVGRVLGHLGPGGRRLQDRIRGRVASSDYANAPPAMRETFRRVIREDLTEFLPRIGIPCLLIWGSEDDDTPLWMGRRMEELLPDGALLVFEGAGHFAYADQPARFAQVSRNFLCEQPREADKGSSTQ